MEKKRKNRKILFFVLLVVIIIISGIIFVLAINTPSTGYQVNKNYYTQVVSPNYCYQITNQNVHDYFIPTNTDAELLSFNDHVPGDISAWSACIPSNYPRIAGWSGKVNVHTNPSTGVWEPDGDCSSGYLDIDTAGERLTYCREFYTETIGTTSAGDEVIHVWKDSGCANIYSWTKETFRCILCGDYTDSSSCQGAGCYFNNYGVYCSRFSCTSYYTYSECQSMGCWWDGSYCHYSPSCEYWWDQTSCEDDYERPCVWENYQYGSCCYNIYDACGICGGSSEYNCLYMCGGCQFDYNNYYCHNQC